MFEGGWWDVTVISKLATPRGTAPQQFVVEACGYGIQHTVAAASLRPRVA